MAEIVLKYTGKDPRTDWLPDVPARDLTEDDIKELGLRVGRVRELGESRLYKFVEEAKPRKPRKPRARVAPVIEPEAPVMEPMTVEEFEGDN